MPIYDFRCLDCNKVSEITTAVDAQAPPCPECGSVKMKRLISTSFSVFGDGKLPSDDFQDNDQLDPGEADSW